MIGVIIVVVLVAIALIGSSIWVISKGYSRKWDE